MPLYLLNRQGTFYYHRRIPASILKANPSLKPVLRISLATGRKSEAIKIAHRLNVMFDEFAKQYFQTPEEFAEAKAMLKRFEQATCQTCLSTTDIDNFFKKYGPDAAEKTAVPDIRLRPVFTWYEGIGFRKLFGAIA